MDFYSNKNEMAGREREDSSAQNGEQIEENVEEETNPSPRTRYRASRKKKKLKITWPKKKQNTNKFWIKLVFKIVVITAVYFNIKFLLNFMKEPALTLYHTFFIVGICAGINLVAVMVLGYKKQYVRFYLALIAIFGLFGYYFYLNYTNHSFLGSNLKTTVLVLIAALIAISPRVNYYMKCFLFLLIPIIGIYLSTNEFALVYTLMFDAGLILFFRKPKSNKKDAHSKKEKKRSA